MLNFGVKQVQTRMDLKNDSLITQQVFIVTFILTGFDINFITHCLIGQRQKEFLSWTNKTLLCLVSPIEMIKCSAYYLGIIFNVELSTFYWKVLMAFLAIQHNGQSIKPQSIQSLFTSSDLMSKQFNYLIFNYCIAYEFQKKSISVQEQYIQKTLA